MFRGMALVSTHIVVPRRECISISWTSQDPRIAHTTGDAIIRLICLDHSETSTFRRISFLRKMVNQSPPLLFRNTTFATLGDPSTGSTSANLSNEILEIFMWGKFIGTDWYPWRSLDIPLKLASRLLLDDRATRYITTMVDGSLYPIGAGNQTLAGYDLAPLLLQGVPLDSQRLVRCSRQDPNAPVTNAMRRRSREIPRDLAHVFYRTEIVAPNMKGDFTGLTPRPMTARGRQLFPKAPSREIGIWLNHDTAWSSQQYAPNSNIARVHQFVLARTLVHEVAHVLSMAVHGHRIEDVFYEDEPCNEAGFNLDNALFGGNLHFNDLVPLLVNFPSTGMFPYRLQYPDRDLIARYKALVNTADIAERQITDKYTFITRIPCVFLASMFTESFWRDQVPGMAGGPIEPTPSHRWIVHFVLVGEWMMTEQGLDQATSGGFWPCVWDDGSLPPRVKNELRSIAAQQGWPLWTSPVI